LTLTVKKSHNHSPDLPANVQFQIYTRHQQNGFIKIRALINKIDINNGSGNVNTHLHLTQQK